MLKLVLLDCESIGLDISMDAFRAYGELVIYPNTAPDEIAGRVRDADVVLTNKCRLNASNLADAEKLKLICIAATGFDNIDVAWCRERGVAVCNVKGYSTDCVAQLTVAMALSLAMHLPEYGRYVSDGSYTASGRFNQLSPAFHELRGKTWGVVGAGNIGMQVARVAEALGCRVIVYQRHPNSFYPTVSLEELCLSADVISLHVPLNDSTRGLIGARQIELMKDGVMLINVARGAVTDEKAVAMAVESGRIGAFACDVYSTEPFPETHPFYAIKDRPGVLLTPHMAWGGVETRIRLIREMADNIKAFLEGERRNRVD